ncbi:AAA family ATPase [Corynebacterium mastitidis]
MKIRSVTVKNFRGIERLELVDLPERGVVVISGDNEQGKSTLMEAVWAVLHERHTGKSQQVKAWQPVGSDAGPEVRLVAQIGPHEAEIHKRWLRRAASTLSLRPAAEKGDYSGREADDRLAALLAEHTDGDLLRALFMEQGKDTETARAAGIPSLTRALDERTGQDAADGRADTALVRAAHKEYQRYYTERGAPRGEWKAAQGGHEAAEERLREAREKVDSLTATVEKVERLGRRLEEARAELPGAQEEAELAHGRHLAAQQARQRRERAQRELRDAAALWESAHTRQEERRALRREAEEARSRVATLEAESEEILRAAREDEQALRAALRDRDEARERLREAREEHDAAVKSLGLARSATRLGEVEDQVRRVAEIDARLAALGSRSVSARLLLTGPEGARVTVDGSPVGLPGEVELREGTSVTIGEITAVYTRGVATEEADPVRAAQGRMDRALGALGCSSLEEARRVEDATCRRAGLEREREAALGAQRLEALQAEREELTRLLDEAGEQPPVPEAEEAERAAARCLRERTEEEAGAADRVEGLRQRPGVAAGARAEARLKAARQRRQELEARLAEAENKQGDAALAEAAEAAGARRESAQVGYEKARAAEEGADLEECRRLWEGAVARRDGLRAQITRDTGELDRLSGFIEFSRGAGERLSQAEAEEAAAGRRLAAVRRRAEAARAVYEALVRHRDAARARYAQPFADQLTGLARGVFGRDVEFRLTEELDIRDRTVAGRSVPLDDLSGGAREQVALLTRFAIAGLVGQDAPVFIDDALGSTDPERLVHMAALITRVG